MRGLFITFEGPDGAGKSTQIKKLASYLEEQGIPFLFTREPGGTAISDRVRSLILDPEHTEMRNETEALLYAASRAQHVREKIVPAVDEGKVVLCDRFVDASIAYQGYGLGIDLDQIKQINAFATGGVAPDRTYMIDVPAEEGKKRLIERSAGQEGMDRIEQKQLDYHERVREGFHAICRENENRIALIDGVRPVEEIFTEIREDFARLLNSHSNS
ncbi:dTMP kinase [Bacillus marinisedimentorum]|uniref:dTMP kinase n=1 Tax=Bacillus marinisedimentorum TaxID=1821260 RepID=UPI000871DD15|nr:dTMP kinase [Bacillus marinisedimentorum]